MDSRKPVNQPGDTYHKRLSKVWFYVFLAFWVCIIIVYGVLQWKQIEITSLVPYSCPMLTLLGLYCPGCGGTRALKCLLEGNLWQSMRYHPIVPCVAVFSLFYIASHTLSMITKGRIKAMPFREAYLFVGLGILLLQWIVKNVLLFV